jgi:hypothetical protein
MAADNTLTFTAVSLSDAGLTTVLDQSSWGMPAIGLGAAISFAPEGGGDGGSTRPTSGMLYPRGQG